MKTKSNHFSQTPNRCKHFYYSTFYKIVGALMLVIGSFGNSTLATHVVGGGITYQQLENDNYLLTVKLYADCSPGTANIPGNVNVTCRRGPDGSNPAPYGQFVLPRIQRDTLTPDVPSCSFDPGVCVEEAIYQAIVTMPAGVGGYHLYYTICCRNGTIQNIQNPLNAQETFYAYVPDRFVHLTNSSPFFNDVPPVYVCAGEDLNLDFSATDFDGDSLVYSFYTPYDGQNNGGITYGAGVPPNNINIAPVNWVNGFGATDPLDAAPGLLPGLTITNGLITGTPTAPGQYVVGVMVDEYRNGVLIGRITRDFQFNVLNCPPPNEAIIDVATTCNGLNVDFINNSNGIINDYWWDFGTTNPADSSQAFEPTFTFPQAGTYTVTLIVEKGLDCADTGTYQLTVMDPVLFNVVVDSISCNGLSDGSAIANATDPNYVYQWSNQQVGPTASNLTLGNHWVHATNTIGCIDTQAFAVQQPNPLAIQFNPTHPLCFDDQNGTLDAMVTGGTAPYSYYWPSENVNGNPLTNVGSGSYAVEVTDANGCSITETGGLNNPPMLTATVSSQANPSCYGSNDGSVMVNANGGTPNYTIDWLTLQNDAFFMDGLTAGGYVAEIYDANGCMTSLVIDMINPDSLSVEAVVISHETCSDANGQLFADANGGTGIIEYFWTPTNETTASISNLGAGQYHVTATDENGCQDNSNAIIVDSPTGTASVGAITPVSCENGNDGSVSIDMTGGTAPFTYNWSCACPDNNFIDGLTAGYYWVEVTDANGCEDTLNFMINELPPLSVAVVAAQNPTCNGNSDGWIQTEAQGGTSPYQFEWSTQPIQTNALATNLSVGGYQVVVTDSNGCTTNLTEVLTEPEPLTVDAQAVGNIICYGDAAGVAQANVTGGTQPYSYFWHETSDTTQISDSLVAGWYNVAVTDSNGCIAADQVEIVEYAEVTAEIVATDPFCPGDVVEFMVLTNGLNNQYEYNWTIDNVLVGTQNTYTAVINDTVAVSIDLVNSGNCPTVTDSAQVGPVFMQPNIVNVFGTPDTICFGSAAELLAEILDTAYITNSWWNDSSLVGLGTHMVHPEQPSQYTFTIENICGQQQSASTWIDVFMPPSALILADGTEGCDEVNVSFTADVDPNYVYTLQDVEWNIHMQNYQGINPIINFTGTALVHADAYMTFSNGCTFEYSDDVAVEVWESPEANFYFNPDRAIEGEITEFVDISHGNPQEWEWYFEGDLIYTEERPSHIFEETGEYDVMQVVINSFGCADTNWHTIEVIGTYTVYVPNAFTPDGNGVNNTFKPVMQNILPDNYQFLIFDRWGEIIFSTDDIEGEWDGRFKGDIARDGVYVWKIMVTDNIGIEHELVGHVTLLK